jgi:hypothetical protein
MNQLIGWVGSALLLFSFFLVSKGKLEGRSRAFQYMQFTGAMFVSVNCLAQHAWPAFAVEVVWALIAAHTLVSLWRKR